MGSKFVHRSSVVLAVLLLVGLALQLAGCGTFGDRYISAARNGKLPAHPGTRVMVLCNGVTDPANCEQSFADALQQRGVQAVSGSQLHVTLEFAAVKDKRRYILGGSAEPLFAVYPAPAGRFDAVLMIAVTWAKDGKRFSAQTLVTPYRVDSKGHPYLGYARRESWNTMNAATSAKGQFVSSMAGYFMLKGYIKATAGG